MSYVYETGSPAHLIRLNPSFHTSNLNKTTEKDLFTPEYTSTQEWEEDWRTSAHFFTTEGNFTNSFFEPAYL